MLSKSEQDTSFAYPVHIKTIRKMLPWQMLGMWNVEAEGMEPNVVESRP